MRSNLDLSGGMISSEAIMLELGRTIGRQHAHDVVYDAAQASASQNKSFPELLASDSRVTAHLSRSAVDSLLDPTSLIPGFRPGLRMSRLKWPDVLQERFMPTSSLRWGRLTKGEIVVAVIVSNGVKGLSPDVGHLQKSAKE